MWHKNKKRSLARWLNSVSAVRTRLEPAQARAFRAIHVTPRRQRRLPPRGASAARSRRPQNKKGDLTGWSNLLSAVRTRLELATPGVTGRYSKPTELPHQLSVNFPFGIAKVQLKFDSANILKEFNEKNVRLCAGHSLERDREVYLTSICLRTFSGSTFLTLAMVTVRTPCSTLAAMSSRFASSGRSIVCWNLV